MYLYSVKDLKSGNFTAPFLSENQETAVRSLKTTLLTSTDSLLKLYPDDYILYEIGNFDNDTGIVIGLEHIRVACCSELIDSFVRKNENVTPLSAKKKCKN